MHIARPTIAKSQRIFSAIVAGCSSVNSVLGTCHRKVPATHSGTHWWRQRACSSRSMNFDYHSKIERKSWISKCNEGEWNQNRSKAWIQHLCCRFAAVVFGVHSAMTGLDFIANQRKLKTPKHKNPFTHDLYREGFHVTAKTSLPLVGIVDWNLLVILCHTIPDSLQLSGDFFLWRLNYVMMNLWVI